MSAFSIDWKARARHDFQGKMYLDVSAENMDITIIPDKKLS